jgi:AraC-like DNA-binding protein
MTKEKVAKKNVKASENQTINEFLAEQGVKRPVYLNKMQRVTDERQMAYIREKAKEKDLFEYEPPEKIMKRLGYMLSDYFTTGKAVAVTYSQDMQRAVQSITNSLPQATVTLKAGLVVNKSVDRPRQVYLVIISRGGTKQ